LRFGLAPRDDGRLHLRFDLGDGVDDPGQAPAFAGKLRLQPRHDRQSRQALQSIRRHRVEIADALGEQQRLQPVAMGGLLLDQPLILAVRALGVLFRFARNRDHPAGVELAPQQARQSARQLPRRPRRPTWRGPRPAVDRHARRIDLVDVVARRSQRAVQPVAVASGLEASMDPGRKPGSLLLAGADPPQKLEQTIQVAALHFMPADRPSLRRADPDEPLRSAQFQCDENRGKLRLGDGRNLLNKHGRSYVRVWTLRT
jgi:hypothetical protein